MDLKASQAPLKDRYREDPSASRVTLHADGGTTEGPVTCSVDIGRAIYEAEAHGGVGGPGTGACSGDLLLGALAACAQITCQMVAANMEVPVRDIAASADGDLDLRGTLGVARDAPVGFEAIRLRLRIDAPDATDEQIASVVEKTEPARSYRRCASRPRSSWRRAMVLLISSRRSGCGVAAAP